MKLNLLVRTCFFVSFVLLLAACSNRLTRAANKDANAVRTKLPTDTKKTTVSIIGEDFYVNGKPTFRGITWKGYKIEGLLPNSRMVNGIFDDLNPASSDLWRYPDTKKWDADRNTREFIQNMPIWKSYGLACFNINMQGGSPQGYSNKQPWINSAYNEKGELRPTYMERLQMILNRADELGMVVNLGLFYFGQDENLQDEKAVLNAVDNTMEWLTKHGYKNIVIEVANECNNKAYNHPIIQSDRIHELFDRIRDKQINGHHYPISTSYNGGDLPSALIIQKSDFILLHGNGVSDPNKIRKMVESVKAIPGYIPKPIMFNEDDHFNFDKELNNFVVATSAHASWGFFDYRKQGEPFEDGYQSLPVDWGIQSERKKGFFNLLKQMTDKK